VARRRGEGDRGGLGGVERSGEIGGRRRWPSHTAKAVSLLATSHSVKYRGYYVSLQRQNRQASPRGMGRRH
jgi:hypothetical protein